MTGPYHSIYSLLQVLPKHNDFKQAVKINKKKFETNINKLGTKSTKFFSTSKSDFLIRSDSAILM